MPGIEIAQYGIGVFAVAGCIYLCVQIIQTWRQKGSENNTTKINEEMLKAVSKIIQNNTEALAELKTLLQVSLAKQEVKLDEILSRLRGEK